MTVDGGNRDAHLIHIWTRGHFGYRVHGTGGHGP